MGVGINKKELKCITTHSIYSSITTFHARVSNRNGAVVTAIKNPQFSL
jgi:hypothetical protein